jgi:predicted membrane channel-forming protein YqfA (hemolysin III family)
MRNRKKLIKIVVYISIGALVLTSFAPLLASLSS